MPSASADPHPATPAPAARSTSARTACLAGSLTVLLLLLVGCTSAPAPPDGARWDPEQAQTSLDRWGTAALDGDRAGYDAELSTADPGFATTAGRLFDNLGQLGWLSWDLADDRRELAAGRRALLASEDVLVIAVDVGWSAAEPTPDAVEPPDSQRHRVWLTWVLQQDHWRIAGTVDGPSEPQQPTPLWWWEPITVQREDSLVVVSGAGLTDWGPRAERAWSAARAAGVSGARVGPRVRGALVQVPSSSLVLARVLGTSRRPTTAAVTLDDPDGAHPVLLDPAANLSEEAWELVITHELVHVLTASPGSGSPRWLVEGLAESVAREAYPGVVSGDGAQARTALQEGAGLPADADLAAGSASAYLRSWVAVRLLEQRIGRAPLLELVARSGTGEPVEPRLQALGWSSAGLAEALEENLRVLAEGGNPAVLR